MSGEKEKGNERGRGEREREAERGKRVCWLSEDDLPKAITAVEPKKVSEEWERRRGSARRPVRAKGERPGDSEE